MPTAYTADLEKDYNVHRWIKQALVRAMGVCVSLREESGDLSPEEILEALEKEESDPSPLERLKEATSELEAFTGMDHIRLRVMYEKDKAEALEKDAKRLARYRERSAKHQAALAEVRCLRAVAVKSGETELVRNTLGFAIEQLESTIEFDFMSEPMPSDIVRQSYENWVTAKTKNLLWHVEYHTQEFKRWNQRVGDRVAEYKKLIRFMDSQEKKVNKSELE